MLRPTDFLITVDSHPDAVFFYTDADGPKGRGYVERDFAVDPPEMFDAPSTIPMIPQSEWAERIKDKEAHRACLSHLRTWPSLDQDGQGFCLDARTPILLADGTQKAVEDFVGGEEVITHLGRPKKVVRPTTRLYSGKLVTTHAAYTPGTEITATACHRFLTEGGAWHELSWLTGGGLDGHRHAERVKRHDGATAYLTAYPEVEEVTDYRVHCLEVEEDHSFVANGYYVHNCWAYSTTGAIMLGRSAMNQPYVRLSAHATACMIKGFRDEGGWCGLSAKRQISHGTPSVALWPEKSMSRAHDNPRTWENAALHKVTEDWIDLTRPVHSQNLTFAQMATCLLLNMPCALDFNWWGHSVAGMDLVDGVSSFSAGLLRGEFSGKLMTVQEFDRIWAVDVTAGFAPRILNSWGNWGDNGAAVLAGSRGTPNGAVCLRVSGASMT